MPAKSPSPVPLLVAIAGLAMVALGAALPWVYLYGHRAQNGFQGGWIGAHLRGHFSDDGGLTVAWQFGADAWIVLAMAMVALAASTYNRGARDQRYDRLQFVLGTLIVAVVLYNVIFVIVHQGDHLVVDDRGGESTDRFGAGIWLVLLGGIVTSVGALLGNTPEFTFEDEPSVPAPGQ